MGLPLIRSVERKPGVAAARSPSVTLFTPGLLSRLARSDYLAAIGTPISWPMISPEITSSTRRFCCRPEEVSFEATGWVFPKAF